MSISGRLSDREVMAFELFKAMIGKELSSPTATEYMLTAEAEDLAQRSFRLVDTFSAEVEKQREASSEAVKKAGG